MLGRSRRIWFKTLEPKERALVNATILCKARLGRRLVQAAKKTVEEVGRRAAVKG